MAVLLAPLAPSGWSFFGLLFLFGGVALLLFLWMLLLLLSACSCLFFEFFSRDEMLNHHRKGGGESSLTQKKRGKGSNIQEEAFGSSPFSLLFSFLFKSLSGLPHRAGPQKEFPHQRRVQIKQVVSTVFAIMF